MTRATHGPLFTYRLSSSLQFATLDSHTRQDRFLLDLKIVTDNIPYLCNFALFDIKLVKNFIYRTSIIYLNCSKSLSFGHRLTSSNVRTARRVSHLRNENKHSTQCMLVRMTVSTNMFRQGLYTIIISLNFNGDSLTSTNVWKCR